MQGWVRFHRKIESWEWYTDPNTFRLFFHLVIKANHENSTWRGQTVKRGQHITSIKKLSENLLLSEKQIRTSLKKLKNTGEVATKGTNKYTLVTVVNYGLYQVGDQEKGEQLGEPQGKQRANKGQTKGKQRATNKNEKNKENDKNEIIEKYSVIFDHWNDQKSLTTHRELTEGMCKAIDKAYKNFKSAEAINELISRYEEVNSDSTYYFSYKWTLQKFLTQGNAAPDFTDEGSKWCDYQSKDELPKIANGKQQYKTVDDLPDAAKRFLAKG